MITHNSHLNFSCSSWNKNCFWVCHDHFLHKCLPKKILLKNIRYSTFYFVVDDLGFSCPCQKATMTGESKKKIQSVFEVKIKSGITFFSNIFWVRIYIKCDHNKPKNSSYSMENN